MNSQKIGGILMAGLAAVLLLIAASMPPFPQPASYHNYHLAPDNARLLWDRLPMAIVFMAFAASLIAERIPVRAGLALLPLRLVIGTKTASEWRWSELHGRGDLRFYAGVQLYGCWSRESP